jgi:alpha-mannosidase
VLITRVHAGPIRAAFRVDLVLPLPASASPDRSSRSSDVEPNRVNILVTLDAASPRVGWHVTLDNRARDHRLRLLFPVGAESIAYVRAETAFGVARRPPRREVPAEIRNEMPVSYAPTISFTDAGDDRAGAILFGEGLMEYEALPPEEHEDARLGLTLLRCVGDLSRDDLVTRSGHAGPGLPTPGAQCLGRHEFRLAFEPRTEPPAAASLFARATSFVAPPRVASVVRAGGTLAPAGSFLRIYLVRGGVVLSACKRGDERDTLILRLFNPDDAAATIRLIPNRPVKEAFLVDFLEERTQSLTVRDGAVDVPVGRHRIKTIELSF